jgi:hypothetical protein
VVRAEFEAMQAFLACVYKIYKHTREREGHGFGEYERAHSRYAFYSSSAFELTTLKAIAFLEELDQEYRRAHELFCEYTLKNSFGDIFEKFEANRGRESITLLFFRLSSLK